MMFSYYIPFICALAIVPSFALFIAYDDNENKNNPYSNNVIPEYDEMARASADSVGTEENWPKTDTINKLGQVAGIAAGNDDILYLFHRGDNTWDATSFDGNNMYSKAGMGPITENAVLIVNATDGRVIKEWGSDRFYMPHGLSLDSDGNVWLTDAALHQVFRFKRDHWDEPDLTIGESFIPGHDDKHLCKPTDVAVSSNGIIYVSDGYCNSRVMVYAADGQLLGQIGVKDGMMIPHSLTLLEDNDMLCVADREGRRVLCYNAGLTSKEAGALVLELKHPMLGRVFAIDHIGDVLFALNGLSAGFRGNALAIDLATEQLHAGWSPKVGFKNPHDLTVSPDAKYLYVTDISKNAPKKVYKFRV